MSTGSNRESLFCLSLRWILSHNLEVGVAFVPGLRLDQTHLQKLFRLCDKGSRKKGEEREAPRLRFKTVDGEKWL